MMVDHEEGMSNRSSDESSEWYINYPQENYKEECFSGLIMQMSKTSAGD